MRIFGTTCVVLMVACTGAPADDPADDEADADTDTDSDTDADTDADTDSDTDTDTEPHTLPEGPGVGGILVDEDGNPLADQDILACTTGTCYTVATESDGWFWLTSEPDTSYALKTHEDLSLAPRRGAALEPCVVTGSEAVDIGVLYAPSLPDGVPWQGEAADPQTFDAGDGLELTMNQGDVLLEILTSFDDVAAVLLPEEQVADYPAMVGEDVIGVYLLHPFSATILPGGSPMEVSVASDLPAGTLVHFRSISILGGAMSEPAIGHADGTRIATDPGQGLTELTHVVISVP